MFPRLLASRGVLFFFVAQTLILTVLVAIIQIRAVVAHPLAILVQQLIDDGETIGVLLIATGVLLEGRESILKRALREDGRDDDTLHLSAVERDLEYYGVVLLIIGLTIELIVAITSYLNEHARAIQVFLSVEPTFVAFTSVVTSFLIIAGIVALIRVIILTYLPQKTPSQP